MLNKCIISSVQTPLHAPFKFLLVCRCTGCNINGLSHWLRAKDTHNMMLYFFGGEKSFPGCHGALVGECAHKRVYWVMFAFIRNVDLLLGGSIYMDISNTPASHWYVFGIKISPRGQITFLVIL